MITIYTVYENPTDYPGQFVARRFELNKPTGDFHAHPDLEKVRDWIHRHGQQHQMFGHRLPREPGDEPQIVETWV